MIHAAPFFLVAQKRYDEIAVDSQAFEPYAEEDERESKRTNDTVKSTKSSAKLIHLFESITGKGMDYNYRHACVLIKTNRHIQAYPQR